MLGAAAPTARPQARRAEGERAAAATVVYARDVQLDTPTVLVLGNEAHGLRTNVRNQCDAFVAITPGGAVTGGPEMCFFNDAGALDGGLDSLNVSTAAAILLHRLMLGGTADM